MSGGYRVVSQVDELELLAAFEARELEDPVARSVEPCELLEAVEAAEVGQEVVRDVEHLEVVVAFEAVVAFLDLVDLVAADVEEDEVRTADRRDLVDEVRAQVDVLQSRPVDRLLAFCRLAVEAGETGDLVLPQVEVDEEGQRGDC